MRCSELMDLLAAPEVVGTAAVAAMRQKQAANTHYFLHLFNFEAC
jgi:hypothetical protein